MRNPSTGDGRGRAGASRRLPAASRVLLWLGPLLFLGAFLYVPLVRILLHLITPESLSLRNAGIAAGVLAFTTWQALLSTLLTLVVGLPAAFLLYRFRFPGGAALRLLIAIPFMLPTVVVAAGFNALLGTHGWINLGLMQALSLGSPPIPFVGTFGAILVAHIFYNTTIVVRIVGAVLASLDPRLEAAARSLGASQFQVLLRVILPMIAQPLLGAALLVFLFDFMSFGVVLLLGAGSYATLEVEIFVRVIRVPNLPLAALLSLTQLIATLAVLWLHGRVSRRESQFRPRTDNTARPVPRPLAGRLLVIVYSILLFVFFSAPLLSLPLRSVWRLDPERGERGPAQTGLTTAYYQELLVNRRGSAFYVPPIRAIFNSIAYAVVTAVVSLLLGIPAAVALTQASRWGRAAGALLMLSLGTSSLTLGLGLIMTYGRWVSSPWVVPIAHTLVALPFVVRTLQPALASIPARLRDAAASLGASPFESWKTVDWPILGRATAAAAGFALTISLGEFGAALLITRPDFPTVPVAIYRFLGQPGGLNYGQAMAMATILMGLTAAGMLVVERLRLPRNAQPI